MLAASPPAAPPASDVQAMLLRAARGDAASEAALLARLRPALRAFASRRLRGPEADEFVQDVSLLLLEALREGRVSDASALGGYALGVCRTVAHDRARLAERRAALWEQFGPREEPSVDGESDDARFDRAVLEDCLGQLTQRARAVIRHAFIAGGSNRDIAHALSLSEGNVRVIRHRALAQLRACLERPLAWGTP